MGQVSGNWVTGTHSGRACHHGESIYTKVNKKTGKCYSVKLCNPVTEWNENQTSARANFGIVSAAIATWINTNKESTGADNADYLKVKKIFDRQSRYSSLRGMMMAKGMYSIATDGTVTVDITSEGGTTSSDKSGGSSSSTTTTKYTLTLVASPAAGGTVSGGGQYTAGTSVTVTATAKAGYSFNKWSDGNTSASRSVTVNSSQTLTATFVADGEAGGTPTDEDDAEA